MADAENDKFERLFAFLKNMERRQERRQEEIEWRQEQRQEELKQGQADIVKALSNKVDALAERDQENDGSTVLQSSEQNVESLYTAEEIFESVEENFGALQQETEGEVDETLKRIVKATEIRRGNAWRRSGRHRKAWRRPGRHGKEWRGSGRSEKKWRRPGSQWRKFASPGCKGLCERQRRCKTQMTPLLPRSDGMSLFVSKNRRNWVQKLPFFLLVYRSAVQETTGSQRPGCSLVVDFACSVFFCFRAHRIRLLRPWIVFKISGPV